MLRSSKELKGYAVEADDEEVGKVNDLLFDDQIWSIRYIVVDTGTFLPGQKVLLSPHAAKSPTTQSLPVAISKDQIRNSPAIDTDKPVSLQKELELHEYYGWPIYGAGETVMGPDPFPLTPASVELLKQKSEERKKGKGDNEMHSDPHLRSAREITGYHIAAEDGAIGHIDDFIVDDSPWKIRYLVVDTKNWLPGKKVIISPQWCTAIEWESKKAIVEMTRESIKGSPEYDPSAPVNREYEEVLYDYYGRPKYWIRDL
jgi:hypothetical protein